MIVFLIGVALGAAVTLGVVLYVMERRLNSPDPR